jgi:aldehyde:ferredoxin oxidoreductase
MPNTYNGQILRVHLTDGTCTAEAVPELIHRRYLGGSALGAYYLVREVPADADPLGPENKLLFMTSVLCGTPISGTNRYSATAKSPLTGGFGESEAGGWWGPELKAAGFDGIIVEGQAERPVWLWVHDGEAELRDAGHLWGKLSGEVQDTLEEELHDRRIRVLQTGVAGEKLVRFAALVNQLKHFHGRCGLGAVMGSKRLKAIAVRGRKKLPPHDQERAREVLAWFKEHYDRDEDTMHKYGTSRGIKILNGGGILPTRNFHDGFFEQADAISGQVMHDTILVRQGTCYSCSVACKREVAVEELGVTDKYGGPEYETIAATGSLCGIGDLKHIALANQKCGQYVLDSISTGATVAFAMECFENGLLTREDTGGIDLRFGNEQALIALIDQIGRREGLGDLLAEGVKRAAEKIGRGAEQFALHVKGQELPMHDPRGKKGLSLAYACSPTGADHMEAPHDPFYEGFHVDGGPFAPLGLIDPVKTLDFGPRKVKAYYYAQRLWSLYNSLGMCDFVGVPIGPLATEPLVRYLNAATGWDTSLWELLKVGERADNLARVFNLRVGFTADDDMLPERLFQGLENGPLQGERIAPDQFLAARRLYYQMNGWDPATGVPTPARLAELDLEWLPEAGRG